MSDEIGLAWLPPFLVGVASAVAAEVSIGLLLYAGEGLLRAATLIVATLLGALALGLFSSPRDRGDGLAAAVRRRWLLALVAYGGGAATAGAWSALGGLSSTGFTRGLGLAFLAGGPLYGSGTVLGAMGSSSRGRSAVIGTAAAAGAASGVVLTGWVLVPSLVPASMYLVSLVALASAALTHGVVLDAWPDRRLVDEEPSLFGTVRVNDRVWRRSRRVERVLTVGGRIVGGREDERAVRPWERAVTEWVSDVVDPDQEESAPILLIGASAVALQGRLREAGARFTVVERNPVVWRMAVRHFGIPRVSGNVRVETGDVLDGVLDEEPGGFGAVVVDGGGSGVGPASFSATELRRVRRASRADGLLFLGGDDPEVLRGGEAARDMKELLTRGGFPLVAAFASPADVGPGRVLIVAGSADAELPEELPGMQRVPLPEHPA